MTSNAGGFFSNDATAIQNNVRMPANWNTWFYAPPNTCIDQSSSSGAYLSVPILQNAALYPTNSSTTNPSIGYYCYLNAPASPGIAPGPVSPQFVLDDALPASLSVKPDMAITTTVGATNLRVYGTNLMNVANVTASSLSGNGAATYAFPTTQTGGSHPAGAYAVVTTGDTPGNPQQVFGMDALLIAHDDQSYTGSFSVAAIAPSQEIDSAGGAGDPYGDGTCAGDPYYSESTSNSPEYPVVTLLTQGKVAVGSMSTLISVGNSPTVVIPFNDQGTDDYQQHGPCSYTDRYYTGAQSALVVNTADNTVSVIDIGQRSLYPIGTVAVGIQPVAAVINSSETTAYIANYGSGTISEVNLVSLAVTRNLSVMAHPTTLAFDSSGNLWVGGQGYVQKITLSSWSVASTTAVDGTIQTMAYDAQQGALIQVMLQNGNAASPTDGATMDSGITYASSSGSSYSAASRFTSSSSVGSAGGDNSAYVNSSAAPYLAYPAQVSAAPPILASTNGDITASVTGTSFTISRLSDGAVLIAGTLPYPARGVALGKSNVYFTMPETSSLITMPIIIP